MKKETAKPFWKKQLLAVTGGKASALFENPVLAFRRDAKAGFYDALGEDEYFELKSETEELSSVWQSESKAKAGALLLSALSMTSVDKAKLEALSEILSDCSESSVYEILDPESPDRTFFSKDFSFEELEPAEDEEEFVMPRRPEGLPLLDAGKTPAEICEYLDLRVCGQEEAKKAASLIMFGHLEGRRSTALFCGPTGSGKTEIWRRLAKAYPKRIKIVDASRLAADGWKGSFHLRDIFDNVSEISLARKGLIVVFDEADKMICENRISSSGMNYSAVVQNDLLKMMDGDVIEFGSDGPAQKAYRADCSRLSVVMLGAFEDLLSSRAKASQAPMGFLSCEPPKEDRPIDIEDLINAGMRREIAGRIDRIASLSPLTEKDLENILFSCVLPDLSNETGRTLFLDDDSAALLVKEAAASGLGARFLRSKLRTALDEMIFDDPKAEVYAIRISEDAA